MQKTLIRQTDLSIAPLALGANVFGWTIDENASFKILDEFTDQGCNFIDTADVYSAWAHNGVGGQSETVIGNWIKNQAGNRDKIIIATKGGATASPDHPHNVTAEYLEKAIDGSLKRLQCDYIDLYYTHFDDNETPVEETLSLYDKFIKAGKIRYVAASNISPDRLAESLRCAEQNNLPRYVALQGHYNLVERRDYEENYVPMIKKEDLSFFPYFSLASGFLSGKYRSESDLSKSVRGQSSVKKYLNEKGLKVISALDRLAEKHNATPASIALAWLRAQETVTAPLASATSAEQLHALFKSLEIDLEAPDLAILDEASAF